MALSSQGGYWPSLHEFHLTTRVSGMLAKAWARVQNWNGAALDLTLEQLPTMSRLELAREALDNLKEIPSIRPLARALGNALETFESALIASDLWQRHTLLTELAERFQSDPDLVEAVTRTDPQRQAMIGSTYTHEQVRAWLEYGALRLDLALTATGTPNLGSHGAGIADNLGSTIEYILEAEKRLVR